MRLFTAPVPDPAAFLKQVSGLNQMSGQVGRTLQQGAQGVMGSLQRAANATGVDFGYLVKTATRESSLNPNAHAPTSSAAGLFQFIEQTWLGMVKSSGAKHGYGAYADQIVKGRDGRYMVRDATARRQVLALRYDADANAVMAAEMTAGHAAYLKGRIGRDATQGELYAAHFLGPDGAADLINASQTRPQATAASLFPAAAHANRSIFYSHGRALNVTEVMANLTRTGGSAPMAIPDADPRMETTPLIMARWDKVKADEAVMQMVFGGQGQDGLLFSTQLMSAFGPGDDTKGEDGGDQADGALNKMFGGDNALG